MNVGEQLPVSPQSHFLVKIESSFIDSQVHYLILLLSYMEVKHHGQVMRTPISKKTMFNSYLATEISKTCCFDIDQGIH